MGIYQKLKRISFVILQDEKHAQYLYCLLGREYLLGGTDVT